MAGRMMIFPGGLPYDRHEKAKSRYIEPGIANWRDCHGPSLDYRGGGDTLFPDLPEFSQTGTGDSEGV